MPHRVKQVEAIAHGTVIDHIPPEATLRVARLLARPNDQVFIGINLRSEKMGTKGVVKIAERELDPATISRLAITAPAATMCIIRDYQVVQKGPIPVPDTLREVCRCPNPNCITNHERCATHFDRDEQRLWRCAYCERHFPTTELASSEFQAVPEKTVRITKSATS